MRILARGLPRPVLIFLLSLAACRDGTGPTAPGGFSVLEGADGGSARVGSEVRVAFRAVDEAGRPEVGLGVSFVVVEGGGHVFAGVGVTDKRGEAREVWTLGSSSGTQALEARTVDPVTGDPRVLGRLELVGRPGIPVRAVPADTTGSVLGLTYDLRDALAWIDASGNYWFDSSFTVVSVPEGITRNDYQIQADHEVSGDVVLRLDTLTVALPFVFVTDLRQGGWRLRVTCTDPASPDGPAVYDAALIGSAYTAVPYDRRHLDQHPFHETSPWPEGYRLRLGLEGTATYKGATLPLHASDQGFYIAVEHRPGYIDVEASHSPWNGALPPEFGRIPATGPGPTWEGSYQMPLVDGVQKVSGFCGYLAANTPHDITMQLRTATEVQVRIAPE